MFFTTVRNVAYSYHLLLVDGPLTQAQMLKLSKHVMSLNPISDHGRYALLRIKEYSILIFIELTFCSAYLK